MKKQAKKKKAAGRGRPSVFGDRRSLLIALREAEIQWLDERASAAEISRTELIMALIEMTRALELYKYLMIDDHGIVCFRPVGDMDHEVRRLFTGEVDVDSLDEFSWPIAIDAKNPIDYRLFGRPKNSDPPSADQIDGTPSDQA